MSEYDIVQLPSDIDLLNENFDKFHFIDGVAIYYDKGKTQRKTFGEYSNFNAWLKSYSSQHKIEPFSFRALLKELVNDVHKELLTPFQADKSFSIPENFMDKLNAIKQVGPAGEPYSYHTVLSLLWQYLPIENNFTLVCEDGSYLMSKNFMILPWYYNNIKISKTGLFKCETRGYGYDRCFPGTIGTSNRFIYWDSQGHYLTEYDFEEIFLKIVRNCTTEPYELLNELNDSIFQTVGPKSNGWGQNKGSKKINWGEERNDGLTFYSEEYRRPRSDSYTDFEYVRDNFDNKMYLNDFYTGLKMLKNGQHYLNSLCEDFVQRQYLKFR